MAEGNTVCLGLLSIQMQIIVVGNTQSDVGSNIDCKDIKTCRTEKFLKTGKNDCLKVLGLIRSYTCVTKGDTEPLTALNMEKYLIVKMICTSIGIFHLRSGVIPKVRRGNRALQVARRTRRCG